MSSPKKLAPIFNGTKRKCTDALIADCSTEVSNNQILDAINALSVRMNGIENNISAMVDRKLATFEESLDARLLDFEKDFDKKHSDYRKADGEAIRNEVLNSLSDRGLSSNSTFETRIDQLERQARMNELVISGVPVVDNENLNDILMRISQSIKFPGGTDSMQSFFRLPVSNKKPIRTNRLQTPSIIIRFWGTQAKSDFFNLYLNKKNLCVTTLGFSAPSRIYVNENLTKKNFEIFCLARQMKLNGRIFRFNTFNGRVFIKLLAESKLIGVESKEQLNSLVSQPQQQMHQVNKQVNK